MNNEIKNNILNDYYKCVGAFINCSTLYKQKDIYTINDNDDEETKNIKNGMKEDLLSNLGKVGEKALKYIISLELLRTNPNIDSKYFEIFFKKSKTINDFAKKHGVKDDSIELEDIINYCDANNQKSHNFDYWFKVFEYTMGDCYNKFKEFIEYSFQSFILVNYCKKQNEFITKFQIEEQTYYYFSEPFKSVIFPYLLDINRCPRASERHLETIFKAKREAIKKGGDLFTRLRYAENNPDGKEFDLDEMYEIINDIIFFIKMINSNDNDLNFNLNIEYAKFKAREYKDILNISLEEINNIFNLDLDENITSDILFELRYKYIKDLLDVGVSKDDLLDVYSSNLNARVIKYYNSIGITDYDQMREMLDNYIDDNIYKI